MIYDLGKDLPNNLNTHAFIQETSLGIMPIGGESDRVSNFVVEIQGNSEYQTRAVTILNSLIINARDINYNPAELLSEVVPMIARGLLTHGCVVCKINKDKENRAVGLFGGPTARWLFHAFGKCKIIGEKDTWVITIPKALGGYRDYRAMIKKLTWFSNVEDMDFSVAKITKRWGWNQQHDSQENCTEFYDGYRILTLKWAQACLREHIFNELNQLFDQLHIKAKIQIKGLPTTADILDIQQQFCDGDISFSNAFKKCLV